MKALRPPNSSKISPAEEEFSGVRYWPFSSLPFSTTVRGRALAVFDIGRSLPSRSVERRNVEFSGVRPLAALSFLVLWERCSTFGRSFPRRSVERAYAEFGGVRPLAALSPFLVS